MGWVSVHDGGAAGLAVRADAPVRLRLSAGERLWAVVRWVLGLAGAVVVLWFGAAFLAASPAAAAVAVPVAAVQVSQKGGISRPAGGKNNGGKKKDSGSDSGSDSG